jgi:HAE1 family hydrophobic/amphiphilic exporter-1
VNLIKLCLARPVGVTVGVLLAVLFGTLSIFTIPVQLTPTVDTPLVNVRTAWPGANPQEIEQEIIDRQEEMLRSVQGLQKMTSSARNNLATIALEFYPDVPRSEALRDVNDKLRQVSGYPLEVDEPTIQSGETELSTTIAWLILYAGKDDAEIRKLRDFAEDFIQPYLDRVPGVASTDIYGGYEREVQVRIDAGKLAARGITFAQFEAALRRQNTNISAGTVTQGKRDYALRSVGQFTSLDEIGNTVIGDTAGGPVYVHDVGEVELAYKDPEGLVRSKGLYVLAFPVRRQTGANVMEVMAALKIAIARVNKEVLQARGMDLDLVQVYDETIYIDQSIALIDTNIVFGGGLAVIVLMLFLRNWRATLTVALSIPVCVIASFLVIVALGRTLNVVSLAGIAFAVGMVVDNCIVVLENIYRHRQMGKDARRAALDGPNEVWSALLAGTLTTMAVFIPVILVREEAGQLFRDISIATVSAVGLSLIVSITVIPVLAARLLRGALDRPTAGASTPEASSGWISSAVARIVGDLTTWPLGARCALVFGVTGGLLWLGLWLAPSATYLPTGNRNLVFGFLLTPPGYSVGEFERMAHTIEAQIGEYWQVGDTGVANKAALDERWIAQVQGMLEAGAIPDVSNPALSALERDHARREWLTPPPLIDNFFFVSFNEGCFMGASSRDPTRVKPLVRLLQTAGQSIPGTFAFFQQAEIFSFGGGNNAEIQIRGDNLDQVVSAASAMQMACMQQFGFPRSNPANFDLGRPELRIVPDRERAAEFGLTAADIGRIVEACGDGAYVGDYRISGGDTVDISLYVKGQKDRPTQDVAQVPIYTPLGRIAPLGAAVRLVDTSALEQINHTERQRSVTLTVTPPESMALETVIAQITDPAIGIERQLRDQGRIDESITISLTGNADKLVNARNAMLGEWEGWTLDSLINLLNGRFYLSILIVYLLLCALYESWVYPFVIMFSVPLAVFGGFLGLAICHWATLMATNQPVQQLDVLTFLGFIILTGTVVNNAILLVDQSLQNWRLHGMLPELAVREAARTRVRPVLMTSLTTFFGQLPLALMPGAGSELYRGLASVMLGGLLVATIGTLVIVPTMLSVVMSVRTRFASSETSVSLSAPPAAAARDR